MLDALLGVCLFLLGYAFCRYRDLPKKESAPAPVSEEEKLAADAQTAQLQAFHTMMGYDETTAYGGVSIE